jgi:hypothetical protein
MFIEGSHMTKNTASEKVVKEDNAEAENKKAKG